MDIKLKDTSFIFLLFQEYKKYGAIGNDMLNRAIGLSLFADTTILLIECSPEFVKHVHEYCLGYKIKIINSKVEELINKNFTNNIIITHTWPKTLYFASKIFGIKNLILIEELLPLSDRLKKPHIKQTLKNKILTFKPVLRIITAKYRRTIKRAKKYIVISDEQYNTCIKYYSLNPDFISYDPIASRFFNYKENPIRNSVLVFNNLCNNPEFIKIVEYLEIIGTSKIICIGTKKINKNLNNIKIECIESYKFQDISKIYEGALICITDEYRGSFELIPIESLASGVPIITPYVPSIGVLKNRVITGNNLPFFDYFKFLEMDLEIFKSWYNNVDKTRMDFSKKILNTFSPENVAKEFLKNLKLI